MGRNLDDPYNFNCDCVSKGNITTGISNYTDIGFWQPTASNTKLKINNDFNSKGISQSKKSKNKPKYTVSPVPRSFPLLDVGNVPNANSRGKVFY